MLVEINLLPKKSNRSKMIFFIIGIIILLLAVTVSLFGWQMNTKKAQLEETQNQLSTTLNIIEAKNKQLAEYNSSTSVQELEQAIKWAETQSFDAVYLLDELTKMLPERGFLIDFKIDENYKINQVIQFDTKSDAAFYLHTLLANEWVEEAVISEAKAESRYENPPEASDAESAAQSTVHLLNEDNVLPRYLAQYEIILNIPALEEAASHADEKQEGDDQS